MEVAMEIKRDSYLKQLIDYAWDGQVKVITGVRRCGKSYLLRTLYKNHLLESYIPTIKMKKGSKKEPQGRLTLLYPKEAKKCISSLPMPWKIRKKSIPR